MNSDAYKRAAADAAIAMIKPRLRNESVVGVGTGSTANHFIDALSLLRGQFDAAVASSEASATRLRGHGIAVIDLNAASEVLVYVDGADEVNGARQLIKGAGGALTREKIVADLAERFVCIADVSKRVAVLGAFPLPVEVIPMAAAQVTRRLQALGARVVPREGFVTDNGCPILDAHGLSISEPLALEMAINQWPGVVTVGLFARRPADILLVGTAEGVVTLAREA